MKHHCYYLVFFLFLLVSCNDRQTTIQKSSTIPSAAPQKKQPLWYPVTTSDQQRISSRLQELSKWHTRHAKKHFGILVTRAGLTWLKTPYADKTLDSFSPEGLVLKTDKLGCVTFTELSLAMARAVYCEQPTIRQVQGELSQLRYRNGIINGYDSRLHYFSEWLLQAQQTKILQQRTALLHGIKLKKNISWMSSHAQLYPPLANQQELNKIITVEKQISKQPLYYIPTAQIPDIEKDLRIGDIVSIVTAKKGLRITHVAIIHPMANQPHILHASSAFGYVGTTAYTVSQYIARKPNRIGITVHRPLAPEKCEKY